MPDYYDDEKLPRLFESFAKDTKVIGERWLKGVLPLASRSGTTALDMGCGSGRWLDLLTERYDFVTGIDPSPEQIKLAGSGGHGAALKVAGLMEITGRWDVVLTYNTLHYVKDPGALPHLRSLVAPGGTLVVVDLTQDPDAKHKWDSLEYQLWDMLHDAEESVEARSRSAAVAIDGLRLRVHPAWLAHALSDPPLTRPEFTERFGAVFRGASFVDLHRVHTGMVWEAPV